MTIVKKDFLPYANNIESGRWCVLISYEPFWRTMKERGVTTYALITRHNISSATIDRMKKGEGITTAKLDDLCRILQCTVSDIIEYIP